MARLAGFSKKLEENFPLNPRRSPLTRTFLFRTGVTVPNARPGYTIAARVKTLGNFKTDEDIKVIFYKFIFSE